MVSLLHMEKKKREYIMEDLFKYELDNETWDKYNFVKVSPLSVGDIVSLYPRYHESNIGRLLRVIAVRKEISQTGWCVTVAVNPESNPIFDVDGSPRYELKWIDCAWFIKYENK